MADNGIQTNTANNRAQILISAVDQTKTAFDSIKRNLCDLGNAARFLESVLGTLGVALSTAGLGTMVKSALDSADALSKLSQRPSSREWSRLR